MTEDNVMMGMGSNEHGQLGLPTSQNAVIPVQSKFGVRKVSSGYRHTIFLMWDGTVWAVGNNLNGQLGDGTNSDRSIPVPVIDSTGNQLSEIVGIAAGDFHSVYLKSNGDIRAMVSS